jgi:FtsP/CotA-like multicopper oxidase with cupredoxin domain
MGEKSGQPALPPLGAASRACGPLQQSATTKQRRAAPYRRIRVEYLTMRKGERVRWYVMSGLNDFDFHTPHWHGNTVLIGGMRTDVTSVAPMQMLVADMVPDNVGVWLFHCHIHFHNEMGMNAKYRVIP